MEFIMAEEMSTVSEKKNGILREGIIYLICGAITTLIDFAISNLLFYLGHWSSIPAQTVSWIASVLFAFVSNKWLVFESYTLEPHAVVKEFISFVACRIVTFVINLAGVYILVDILGFEFFICKMMLGIIVVILNYVFSKLLIFKN